MTGIAILIWKTVGSTILTILNLPSFQYILATGQKMGYFISQGY